MRSTDLKWPHPGIKLIAFRHNMALLLPGPPIIQMIGGSFVGLNTGGGAGTSTMLVFWPINVLGWGCWYLLVVSALLPAVAVTTCLCWLGAVSTLTILPGISFMPLPIPATPFKRASWLSWAPKISKTDIRKSLYTSDGARSPFTWVLNIVNYLLYIEIKF